MQTYYTLLLYALSLFPSSSLAIKGNFTSDILSLAHTTDEVTNFTVPSTCGPTQTTDLIAGQNYIAGSITISNDADNIYVTYTTTAGWYLNKVHLFVGNCNTIPTNNGGNPIIGQFPYVQQFNLLSDAHMFTIPKLNLDDCICVSAHAELVLLGQNGNIIQTETGWASGDPFGGKSWAKKIKYCIQDCPDVCDITINVQNVTSAGCSGNNGSAIISAQGGVAPYTYTVVNTSSGSVYSNNLGLFDNLPNGNYIILVNDVNQCQPECQNTSFEIEHKSSELTHTAELANNCQSRTSTIELHAIGSNGPYLYSIGGSFSSSNEFFNVVPGSYNTAVLDANGCVSTLAIIVSPTGPPALSVQHVEHATCWQQNGSIHIQGSGGLPSYTYFLTNIFTNQIYTNSTGVFTNLPSGSYTAQVVDANGCNNQSVCSLIQLKNINKNCHVPPICGQSKDNRLVVYPNPASSRVFLYFEKEISSDVTITIRDQTGKLVYITSDFMMNTDFEIDLLDVNTGSYFVNVYVQETGENFNSRLVVMQE